MKRYEELAHEHRIDAGQQWIQVPVNGCTAPTTSDWSTYDGAMTPYMNGSYFADGVPSSRFDVPFSPGSTYGLDMCTSAEYTALAAAWATHLKGKGWFDKAIAYAYDEPPECTMAPCDPVSHAAIAQGSSWLQKGDPDWKSRVMDTTSPDPVTAAILDPALGIYTVNLPWYDDWNAHGAYYGRAEWPSLFSQGIKLWFYESDSVVPPYPTFASNTLDGLEPVMAMWGSWYEKASGFLYYDIANWTLTDPWGPNTDFGLTGDGVLLYPGNHDGTKAPAGSPANVAIDGPIPSYRLKMVRNGLQDWALFKLADQKGLTAMVQQQMGAVYQQLGGCTYSGCPMPAAGFFWKDDEAAMDGIRQAVAAGDRHGDVSSLQRPGLGGRATSSSDAASGVWGPPPRLISARRGSGGDWGGAQGSALAHRGGDGDRRWTRPIPRRRGDAGLALNGRAGGGRPRRRRPCAWWFFAKSLW